MVTYIITQGDLGDLVRVKLSDGGAMDSNYECNVAVQGTAIAREVTDKSGDNTEFLVQLLAAETVLLRPGSYTMGIKITNTTLTPPFSREEHIRLDIQERIVV